LAVDDLFLAVRRLYSGNCYKSFAGFPRKETAMSYKLFYWIAGLLVLLFIVFAYNSPVEGASMTSQARINTVSSRRAALPPQSTATTPQSLVNATPSVTPTTLSADTVTPTYTVPMLTLREATNCRTGPGKSYELIVLYPVNQTLEIAGRYEPGNFWLVKSPESPNGTCWLWGEFVDVAGSYESVPPVTPPPTSAASPSQALNLPEYRYYCDSVDNTLSFNMTWRDRGNTARYRIFRDGLQIAQLPAGATTYSEIIGMPVSQSAEYFVQVYNADGSENLPVVRVSCL
jgi:hypothetical protein